jgi:ketosteroid isomerase-like protein
MTSITLRSNLVKNTLICFAVTLSVFTLTACSGGASVKPDFDTAIQKHFEAISNRDIEAFTSHLTKGETLYTIVQNGHAFTTPAETIEIHKQWFKDPKWVWEGSVIHKVLGEDMAMALVKYQYRAKPEDIPIVTWLTYVFQLQEGQWRIVHDQNTALDFAAFARMVGIEIK